MTEREAIQAVAALVAEIAARCWNDLGTDRSQAIQTECGNIVQGLDEPADASTTDGGE